MRSLALALLPLLACADAGDVDTDEAETSADATTEGSELRVRAHDTTVWIDREIRLRGDTFVLAGRASRNVLDGTGFVMDDPYGDFATKSARTFEVTWPVSVARTLADGTSQFIRLELAPSTGRPSSLTSRVIVRPRLAAFTGSTKIYLTAALLPVIVDGQTVYRVSGSTTAANTEVRATLAGAPLVITRTTDRKFTVDLMPEQLFAAYRGDLAVRAELPTGGVEKHARLGLEVDKLGLTSLDAYDVWPRAECPPATLACLGNLPASSLDLGACGEANLVGSCRGRVGVVFDDVAFSSALQAVGAQLATPAARTDATGLVGADRADEFLYVAEQAVNSKYERMFGRWYLSATARAKSTELATTAGLDHAYARPLDYLEPRPGPDAGDAILLELARMDFPSSEFARPLEAIVHDHRARHVASIAAFRAAAPAPYPGTPAWDLYLGDWIGLHAEVVVERATGDLVRTLVEID